MDLVLQDGLLGGKYTGSDCDGQERNGHVAPSHTERYMKPPVMRADDGRLPDSIGQIDEEFRQIFRKVLRGIQLE